MKPAAAPPDLTTRLLAAVAATLLILVAGVASGTTRIDVTIDGRVWTAGAVRK